ncbi:hypothetical protein BHYA_0103g00170 [Botrytis hyacinthi]|uniref:Uncharacterized protein n=1 Tax=Botrytis hyacinthi TaxID=278943 RepID=A0A4Z1GKI9_9HELO|nr:hypothetical protein BHYA_0103g00170 [Botrytis hyacinthi]
MFSDAYSLFWLLAAPMPLAFEIVTEQMINSNHKKLRPELGIESEMSFLPSFNQFSMDPIDANEGFAVPLPAPPVKFKSLSGWRGTKPFTDSGSVLE